MVDELTSSSSATSIAKLRREGSVVEERVASMGASDLGITTASALVCCGIPKRTRNTISVWYLMSWLWSYDAADWLRGLVAKYH